jgi:Predicted Rossmann fold nucleotide-binding protein
MYDCCPHDLVEIESAEALRRHIAEEESLRNTAVQGIDLTAPDIDAALTSVPAEDACFLGCELSEAAEEHVRETGGTIFPGFVGVPFRPYRSSLYTPAELMEGYERGRPETRDETIDARIYRYFKARKRDGRDAPVMDALAFRIHDHAIDNALRDLLSPDEGAERRVVGIMGGHQLRRDDALYRQVARLAWRLTQAGFFVATGGGPGAMEAANLGAALAPYEPEALDDAVSHLASAPHYEDATYVDRAYDVREHYPDRAESLAVPTWFYGHEPSTSFRPTWPSTSPTASGRTACSPSPRTGLSTPPAAPAPSRRCSWTRPKTTTRPSARPVPWCFSTARTGLRRSQCTRS